VVVSFLLQAENFRELDILGRQLKDIGVDSLEVKMQHFDARRHMSEDGVEQAYRCIDQVRRLDDGRFRVVVVQSKEDALKKVRAATDRITFSRCYANELGLNPTVDPEGFLQTCCQYYQSTLGRQGSAKLEGFEEVWKGKKRRSALDRNPQGICDNCSPSDEFLNRFVDFLREANGVDGSLLTWVQKQIELVPQSTSPRA
jgi:hypothetical protein